MAKKFNIPAGDPGFTLVELIVVISIVGILSAVAILSFDSPTLDAKIESATKKLMSDIIYAQDLAFSSGSSVQVIINTSGNSYSLKWDDGSYVTNITGGGDFVVDFDSDEFSGVSLSGSGLTSGTLTFNSLGVPETGGSEIQNITTVIVLNNRNSIKITPYTGRVYFESS